MTLTLIEKKVRAEIEVSKKGLGEIALYGLVRNETKDESLTKAALKHFGYTLTEIAEMKAKYNYSRSRSCRV